jgi:hypothetical protein
MLIYRFHIDGFLLLNWCLVLSDTRNVTPAGIRLRACEDIGGFAVRSHRCYKNSFNKDTFFKLSNSDKSYYTF